ncbi:MAG: YwaF family protein [Oscillospiraceae bacterium]|nr:YwaF family protein [Oscillospiraceae bacterium]
MFTWRHILWLLICLIATLAIVYAYGRKRPPLSKVLTCALTVSVLSELVKIAGTIEMVPSAGGSLLLPYLPTNHLPLHFCSIQVILIAFTRFTANTQRRETVLAFMYPTCVIGAAAALLMPSIFTTSISVEQAFTSPVSYQFFVFHTMLLALGIIIVRSGEIQWKKRHFTNTLLLVYLLGFLSIYLNSMLASPTYVDGELKSVDFWTNFFFTYQNPLGIQLTSLWQWFVYLLILSALAAVLLYLFYRPLIRGKNAAGMKAKSRR